MNVSRAAVIREYNAPLKIEHLPLPDRIEDGSYLIKTAAASICGTDVHLWRGKMASISPIQLPVVLGHEGVGHIVKAGKGTGIDSVGNDLSTGDRVLWTHPVCGSCFYCTVQNEPTLCENRNERHYMYSRCDRYPYLLGTLSEFCYVSKSCGMIKVPDNVSDELASAASCAFRTVMHAFGRLGTLQIVQNVVIQGAGPLGLFAVPVARVLGARNIILIGAPNRRLEVGKELGADHVISVEELSPDERVSRVRDLTRRGAEVVMEFSGARSAIWEGLEMLQPGGRYVVIGQLDGTAEVTLAPAQLVRKNVNLLGSFSATARDFYQALEFVSRYQRDFPLHRILSNTYRLDQINEALERMERFEEVKPVIRMDNP